MMFISRFNKLIRNKYIWGGFAFIVILSFVAWQTNTGGISEEETKTAGKLDGKPVPAAEIRSAYFNSYLSMSLMVGRALKITPRVDDALRYMAWRRLIAVRGASEARLAAGPEEVVAAVQQQPFFQEGGRFSPARYTAFVQQFLASLSATEKQFEEHVRQEILLSKARLMLAQAVWVAPLEIEQIYHQFYDTFVISYVRLNRGDFEHSTQIGEKEARAYYQAHTNDFMIPALMRVKYVEFPFERFLDEGALDEACLRSYYDEHIEEFTSRGTGDLLSARSFEEVEDSLRDQLALNAAETTAGDQAADFEVALAPNRKGLAPSFEKVAETFRLAVMPSPAFSSNTPVPGLQVDLDFNKAAFALRSTPDEYFSHPVRGSNSFYVLAFDEKIEARIPKFDEISAKARRAALDQAISNKLAQTAEAVFQSAVVALKEGRTFEQAVRPYGLEVITTEPFALRSGLEDEDQDTFYELAKNVLFLNAGELSGVIAVPDGAAIAVVDSRVPAAPYLLPSIKSELGQYIRKRRDDLALREWQEYLLKEHKYEDAMSRGKNQAADPEDAETEAETAEEQSDKDRSD